MMKYLKENFQETSESEMQAIISAQQSAISLHSETSQATSGCDYWKTEVKRLTKQVAEQSTKRVAGRNSLHHSTVPLSPPGTDCSQPYTPTQRVDSPLQTSRPTEGNPWEHIPLTSTAQSDTRSVAYEKYIKKERSRDIRI